ncbi:MAG: nitroreductase family protein [Acidimicrobiia bacterium]|nr:nitroreductase family protein [Acidimicrobiia bacterium]
MGAFDDNAVMDVLGLPADHRPLYLLALGRPA